MQRAILAALLCASFAIPSAAMEPYLVKDINPFGVTSSSEPKDFVTLGPNALFVARDWEHGSELWRSDGTEAGTFLLADACEGPCYSEPSYAFQSARHYFYYVFDGSSSRSLWWTDGTRSGTRPFVLGPDIHYVNTTIGYLEAQHVLLFGAFDGHHGRELWRSDGTAAGTYLVRDLSPGADDSFFWTSAQLGNRMLFTARDSQRGSALWVSDGTAAGTRIVKDFYPGKNEVTYLLASTSTRALVGVSKADQTVELWMTDGTPAGTKRFYKLPAHGPTSTSRAAFLAGRFYLIVGDDDGKELWTSDGTAAGTLRLTSFSKPEPFSGGDLPSAASVVGTRIFFAADDGTHGMEPWVSNGTVAGTRMLRDVCPGPCSSAETYGISTSTAHFFPANDGAHGNELWSSDGTTAGTRMVKDLCPGSCGSDPQPTLVLGGRVAFGANDGHGRNLWSTVEGPRRMVQLTHGGIPLYTVEGASTAHGLVFQAAGIAGNELWRSDATIASTRMLADLDPSQFGGSFPAPFAALGDRVLAYADDGLHGQQLWVSRGTDANTELLHDFGENAYPRYRGESIVHAETAGLSFFMQTGPAEGCALWRTDGTSSGTFALTSIACNPVPRIVAAGSRVFFTKDERLWQSDGSLAGTAEVDPLSGERAEWAPAWVAVGSKVALRTTADGSNFHVWLTDGSPTGTSLAFDRSVNCLGTLPNRLLMVAPTEPYGYADALLATDGGANAPAPLSTFDLAEGEWIGSCTPVTVGNRLFLFLEAHRGQGSSPELWVSDGTAAGTRLLAAVRLSTSTRAPAPVALGNQLYFSAGSEFLGELWTSDGTPAGTEPWTLAGEPVYPLALAVFSSRLVFAVAGVETAKLWQTDGSPGGTTPVGISTQAEQPFLVPTSNRLYFPARQAATGVELWALRD